MEWQDVTPSPLFILFLLFYFLLLGFQWTALIFRDVETFGAILELEISVHWDSHFRTDPVPGTGARAHSGPLAPRTPSPSGEASCACLGCAGFEVPMSYPERE